MVSLRSTLRAGSSYSLFGHAIFGDHLSIL
jgi:hypothetical protein